VASVEKVCHVCFFFGHCFAEQGRGSPCFCQLMLQACLYHHIHLRNDYQSVEQLDS